MGQLRVKQDEKDGNKENRNDDLILSFTAVCLVNLGHGQIYKFTKIKFGFLGS